MIRFRLLVVVTVLVLARHAAALDQYIPAGTSAGPVPGSPAVTLEGTLLLNTSNGALAAVTSVTVNASTAAIDVRGSAGTITLGGPLEFNWDYYCGITGNAACRLALPNVWMKAAQSAHLQADGPGVDVGNLYGVSRLGGSAIGCTVSNLFTISGNLLEKYGTGAWTVTGDNSARTWGVDIGNGRITLGPGAKFGSGSVTIANGAFLALPTGVQLSQSVYFENGGGGTLDLADGVVGQTSILFIQGPVNCLFNLSLDISADGVDRIVVGDTAGASAGKLVFDQVGPALTPGTYIFVNTTGANQNLLEQHFGFDYTGSFEDHYNIVYTSRLGQYDLTVRAVFVGTWPAMTVQVTPTSGDPSKRPPLALPLPGERGREVMTGVNTPVGTTLAGRAYDGATLVSYTYAQPARGTVTGAGSSVTYTPATNYTGTDSFTFAVTDNYGSTSAPATIYIGVGAGVNLPPMAFPQLGLTTAANTAKAITLSGVDYGIYGYGTISAYAYTQPAHGTVTGAGPNVTYTPATNYTGADRFTFTVSDTEGAASTPALVTLNVGSIPPTPTTTTTLTTPALRPMASATWRALHKRGWAVDPFPCSTVGALPGMHSSFQCSTVVEY